MFDFDASKHSDTALSGRRILVVDDSLTNMAVAVDALRMCGAEVDEAPGGKRAMEMVAVTKYDLVLLDLNMPTVDGYAVGAAVRASRDNASTPIVLFTAADPPDAERAVHDVRAQDIVHKPVDVDVLIEIVGKHLEAAA